MQKPKNKKTFPSLLLLLFLSGTTALIFQTLWVKQLGIVIGVDIYSTAIVISGFFTGLGLGSYFLGKYIEKKNNQSLQIYIRLEVLTAISGVLISSLLYFGEQQYVLLEASIGKIAYLLPWLLIAIPAFFMSGTFLALLKYYQPQSTDTGKDIGYLYGSNTAGAILGALLTPFLVIPTFGVLGAGLFTAFINLLLGGYAYWVLKPNQTIIDHHKVLIPSSFHIGYILYGFSGFIAIAQEILWGQIVVQFQNTRTYAFATMLAVYLLGLALGNFLMGKNIHKIKNYWLAYGTLTLLSIFSTLLAVAIINQNIIEYQVSFGELLYSYFDTKGALMMGRFLFISAFFILLPTTFMGALFPVASLLVNEHNTISETSGKLLAWNTIGGVLGSLMTGFVLFPILGVIYTLFLLLVMSLGVAFVSLYQTEYSKKFAPLLLSGFLFFFIIPKTKFIDLLLQKETGKVVYFKEGIGNTVAVIEQGQDHRTFRRLYIQGVSNTGDVFPSLRYMRLQSFIPLITFNGTPKSALVVGLGTGITAGSLLQFPELEERAVVELLPEVVEATELFEGNYQLSKNKKIDIYVEDGRHKLMREKKKYDLITLEPPPPTAVGVNNLYSKDFYQLCQQRLTDQGMMAQWWPITTQTMKASESLVRAVLDVFPYANLWTTEMHEMLIIGSNQPLTLDLELIKKRLNYPSIKSAMNEIGVHNEAQFLSTYVMDRGGLHVFSRNAKPVTDNDPILEYDGWVKKSVITDILPRLLEAQEEIPNLPEVLQNEILYERENLHRFYYAGMASYVGRRDVWSMLLTDLYQHDSTNVYYNWYDPAK